jgi:hypothetical protein
MRVEGAGGHEGNLAAEVINATIEQKSQKGLNNCAIIDVDMTHIV